MAKINYTNNVLELVVPTDAKPREILLKTDAKDKLVRAQMAANPYNPVLDNQSVSTPEVITPVMEAPKAPMLDESINTSNSVPFSSPIDPAILLREEPVISNNIEEPVTAPSMEEPKAPISEVNEEINPVEALQRVEEALSISMKIVNECLSELNKETPYKKVA